MPWWQNKVLPEISISSNYRTSASMFVLDNNKE
jgi:hypothetical protein